MLTSCSSHLAEACLPQLVINEVDDSSPQTLQAVKLLAQYHGKKVPKVQPSAAT